MEVAQYITKNFSAFALKIIKNPYYTKTRPQIETLRQDLEMET